MNSSLPKGDAKVKAVRTMFDTIAPRYDLVNRVMTFGMDIAWRKKAVGALRLPEGALILDVACGTGDFCRELLRTRHRAIGFDMSAGMLANARTTAPLALADALKLPLADAEADGITCGFALRNVADLSTLFEEFARVVRQGARIALLEVAEPTLPFMKAGHYFYFRKVVPVIGGLLSDKSAYRYLPRSTQYLPPADKILEMVATAGFSTVERQTLGMGAAQLITATRI